MGYARFPQQLLHRRSITAHALVLSLRLQPPCKTPPRQPLTPPPPVSDSHIRFLSTAGRSASEPTADNSRAPARRGPPHRSAVSLITVYGGGVHDGYICSPGVNNGCQCRRGPPCMHARCRVQTHPTRVLSAPPPTMAHSSCRELLRTGAGVSSPPWRSLVHGGSVDLIPASASSRASEMFALRQKRDPYCNLYLDSVSRVRSASRGSSVKFLIGLRRESISGRASIALIGGRSGRFPQY